MKSNVFDLTGLTVLFGALAALPLVMSSTYWLGVLAVCFIYGVWAASLDFMSGLTGRMNFGHTLFIGGGAYTSALMDSHFGMNIVWAGLSGISVAVLLSLIIGLPTLRLQGAYFVLATFTAPAIMQRLVRIFWEHTGGDDGMSGLTSIAPSAISSYYICLASFCLTVVILLGIAHSTVGLRLKAIRGDEDGARGVGIDTPYYKILALAVSAAFGGLGGVLYVHFQGAATPDVFSVGLSMTIVIMAYVGGLGSIFGAAIAALLLSIMPEAMREFGQYRLTAYGILIIIIALFYPRGLIAPLWNRIAGPKK